MDSSWTKSIIKGKILHKLTRAGKFHHSHTAIENLTKGFPTDARGEAKTCVEELIGERVLFVKRTSYGVHVSVNTERCKEIIEYVDAFFAESERK